MSPKNARVRAVQLEHVTAEKLRDGDCLVACDDRVVHVWSVEKIGAKVLLVTPGRVFDVPASCRFVRQYRSRKINMRPDLG